MNSVITSAGWSDLKSKQQVPTIEKSAVLRIAPWQITGIVMSEKGWCDQARKDRAWVNWEISRQTQLDVQGPWKQCLSS